MLIPHNLPTLGQEEQGAALRVLASGWVAQGSEVEAFENELCRFLDLPDGHAVAVSSGTAALYLALWVLEASGKRVGLPVYACAALRNAVGLIDGKCVFLDCEAGSPNVSLVAASRSNLDILIAPSMFGIPAGLPEAREFALIEDLAQSLGAMAAGRRIGLRGDVGICSFYATKLMTTAGQGGALISRDKELIGKIRDYREFDCRDDMKLRFNFQMTDVQAAVGRIQLGKLPDFLGLRERLFRIYRDAGLNLIDSAGEANHPVRYRAVMRCPEPEKLITALRNEKVRAIVPIELWELLDKTEKYPVAEELTCSTVSLPIYPSLEERVAQKIAGIARTFI